MNILETSFIQISNLIRNSNNLKLGSINSTENSSGDLVKELDIRAHNIIIDEIHKIPYIKGYISEESDDITFISPDGQYIIAFDPLDGSSNINSNISVGSIYGLYLWDTELNGIGEIVEAGYCLYGPSTTLVRTQNESVKMFQLNNENEFKFISNLSLNGKSAKIYSINESNYYKYQNYKVKKNLIKYKMNNYSMRLVGSMVADCHRTLIQGGIFMYPATNKDPKGKLRIAYEVMPFAKIFELCGGASWDGEKSILKNKIDLNNVHKKIPTYLGTKEEIYKFT